MFHTYFTSKKTNFMLDARLDIKKEANLKHFVSEFYEIKKLFSAGTFSVCSSKDTTAVNFKILHV